MKTIGIIAVCILLGGGGFWGYRALTAGPEIEILDTAVVRRGHIREVLVETGIIKPQVGAQVKIGARATGEIVEMKVKVGDVVSKGQLIARIDDREILHGIDQTLASIDSTRSTLKQIEQTYPERIREASARYEYARIKYQREKKLVKKDYTTQEDVDLARRERDINRAIHQRLKDEFVTQRQIVQAELASLEAQLAQQRIRHSYTEIVTPMAGVVSEVTAQEGETIVTGLQVANLVTVLAPEMLEMWIYVDETDVARVNIGQAVEYSVDTYPARTFHGVISRNYPEPVVRDNITYYLSIVRISKADAMQLRPEMTTYVKIVINEKSDVLLAPNAAVKFQAGKQVAYRVQGKGTIDPSELEIGIRGEDETEILSGVREGDILATRLIIPVSADATRNGRRAGGAE